MQGLKGPILITGAGSVLEKDMVLCGVLVFYIIFSLYVEASKPRKKSAAERSGLGI